MIAQIFPRTGRISGPEVADGAKPDVSTTDVENEKKKPNTMYFIKFLVCEDAPRYYCRVRRLFEGGACYYFLPM